MSGFRTSQYSQGVLDHYRNPRNTGSLPEADAVGVARGGPHGDILRLAMQFEAGRIAVVCFQARGCPAAIASGSAATELLAGCTPEEARRLSNHEVAAHLGGMPESKMDCSVLVEQAVADALKEN